MNLVQNKELIFSQTINQINNFLTTFSYYELKSSKEKSLYLSVIDNINFYYDRNIFNLENKEKSYIPNKKIINIYLNLLNSNVKKLNYLFNLFIKDNIENNIKDSARDTAGNNIEVEVKLKNNLENNTDTNTDITSDFIKQKTILINRKLEQLNIDKYKNSTEILNEYTRQEKKCKLLLFKLQKYCLSILIGHGINLGIETTEELLIWLHQTLEYFLQINKPLFNKSYNFKIEDKNFNLIFSFLLNNKNELPKSIWKLDFISKGVIIFLNNLDLNKDQILLLKQLYFYNECGILTKYPIYDASLTYKLSCLTDKDVSIYKKRLINWLQLDQNSYFYELILLKSI